MLFNIKRSFSTELLVLEDIHKVLDEGTAKHRALGMNIKKEAMRLGLHRDLNLDSISGA